MTGAGSSASAAYAGAQHPCGCSVIHRIGCPASPLERRLGVTPVKRDRCPVRADSRQCPLADTHTGRHYYEQENDQ